MASADQKKRQQRKRAPQIPVQSPVQPVELRADSKFQFNCHKGVSCFNACCKSIDLTLLPYDIVRLKRRAGLTSSQWVNRYTRPYPMDAHEMPGLKMACKPGTTECVFLREEGCSVYEDRPSACRYYALGAMGIKRARAGAGDGGEADKAGRDSKTDSKAVEEIYFLVKETHCKGHAEPRTLTVTEYRREQGLEEYDEMNREWRDLILKKRSAGPTIGKPSARSLQLFDMCSYDIDNFRAFVSSDGFGEVFDLPAKERAELLADEDALLLFSFRFLRQVLFGEMSIAVKADARKKRLQRKRARGEAE